MVNLEIYKIQKLTYGKYFLKTEILDQLLFPQHKNTIRPNSDFLGEDVNFLNLHHQHIRGLLSSCQIV